MSNTRNVTLAPDLYMILARGGSPNDNEWAQAMRDARTINVPRLRRLIVSLDGSALTTPQRRQMDKMMHDRNIECLTAVMTASSAVRALFVVFRWLGNNKTRVFAMDDLIHACEHLEMTTGEASAAQQEFAKEVGSLKKVG